MVLPRDDKIEHFRGGGGGGGGRGGGFGRGGGYGVGGIGNYAPNGSGYGRLEGSRNPNIRYGGYNNYSGSNYGYNYAWNNYPLYYNNYIPVDPNESNDEDNNNNIQVVENFNNSLDNNNNLIWYIISIVLIFFILTKK